MGTRLDCVGLSARDAASNYCKLLGVIYTFSTHFRHPSCRWAGSCLPFALPSPLVHTYPYIHTYTRSSYSFFFFVFGSLLAVGVVSVVVSLLICALLTSWLRLVLLATSSPCRACRRLAQIVAWPARRVFNQTAHKMASELHRGSSLNTHCKLQVTRTQWRCRSN